jgi:CubicO group peptidase (beta-lactamase class C family)
LKNCSFLKYGFFILSSLILFNSCEKNPAGIESYQGEDWWVSSPELQRLNSQRLAAAYREAKNLSFVDALLISKNGVLVSEKYYNGYDSLTGHNVKSISKSFLSALIGIALRENYLTDLDQAMLDFFPEYNTPGLDPRKNSITLRHLLTQKAGYKHERYNYSQIFSSSNWIRACIEFQLTFDPGAVFSYNTAQTHLLSGILTKCTEINTREFAETYLLGPSNITLTDWRQDPQDIYFGGNNMYFPPRSLVHFGQLYINGGNMDGNQIVPAEWIEDSWKDYSGQQNVNWGHLHHIGYGYLWWLGRMDEYQMYLAIGYGGQFIIDIPSINMIIVTTAESRVEWGTSDWQVLKIIELVYGNIIPAIMD